MALLYSGVLHNALDVRFAAALTAIVSVIDNSNTTATAVCILYTVYCRAVSGH
jgi:hypothetical protein